MADSERTLNRFVLRARRIEAHSLARDRRSLSALSDFSLTGQLHLDGTMEMRRALPDEEAFESLAARVRPVLVKSESVFQANVLKAIQAAVDVSQSEVPADLLRRLADLKRDWSRFDLDGTNVLRFAVQSSRADGSDVTPQVSDTQLAAAWLYGDLVHVDTRGSKSDGLLFPIKERYSAAVTYFAHAAVLCLMTLDLVLALHRLGVIALDAESVEREVVVGVGELVERGAAYLGPVGSPMPDLDIALAELPEGFQAFTVTELLRQSPANRVRVECRAADGSSVCDYEAAVSRRGESEGRLHWAALVAGSVTFTVSFGLRGDRVTDARFEGIEWHGTTNRMKLAEAVFEQELTMSEEVVFFVGGEKFFVLRVSGLGAKDAASIDVAVDSLYDLVVIENITRQALQPLSGMYSGSDRALLRRTRLLWEGEVVPFRLSPLTATAPAGVVPKAIVMPATTLTIAGTEFPVPTTLIRHPLMVPESITRTPESDPPTDQITMVIPVEEPFLAWAPEKRTINGDDDLPEPTPWDLSHFDDQVFLGGRKDSA
ncbi:hypothetical protein JKP75_09270 [Blastococcus sp. TML/M2B]|uniref:hypothetical protein n=1 Tax=unclassified Blastococcus TaxID=2619396 RepID=UPI001909E572|nr:MULTISPECIES: hypothetical protein [unclassified Blastococcus]MBN1092725.1 hypothetical protein [Blastococcus sp. TML/M2B]MBN1097163.1 hypothetical protein [Blastococcus sp. TML/C7B]